MLFQKFCFLIDFDLLKVAIVLLAVVAVVAAESYGYEKAYKPAYKEEYAYVRN